MKPTPIYSVLLLSLFLTQAFGHGTEYSVSSEGLIAVQGRFDSGEPLAGARVLVFQPGETEAAYELKSDTSGIVCLKPDRTGTWILQMRDQGGHGIRVNLEVTADMVVKAGSEAGSLSLMQKLLMALCVVIGLGGTALYFKGAAKRKKEA